jgi:hypothetical protein
MRQEYACLQTAGGIHLPHKDKTLFGWSCRNKEMNHLTQMFACVVICLAGCSSTKPTADTIAVAPIHITVDATIRSAATNEPSGIVEKADGKNLEKSIVPRTVTGDLLAVGYYFYTVHHRWPTSLLEITNTLKTGGESTVSFETLEWINFRILADGRMEIRYKTNGSPSIDGCLTIKPPEMTDKTQPVVGASGIPAAHP